MLPARVDEHDKAARLGSAVLASWAAWPLCPAVFAFLVGSGRMRDWREKVLRSPGRWSNLRGAAKEMASWPSAAALHSSGNVAVNACRTVELGRLGVQEQEFRTFLNRLCIARNNEEFDRFLAEQRRAVAKQPPSAEHSS